MGPATPKKLVHWALNASLSELSPPFSEVSTSESCSSTSSLQYINSQLAAHGFIHDAGLSLDGLAKGDADQVVKCVLGMLSQRIDDMSRTEDLSTKLRTLSYDHERLMSMYKTKSEKAATAEREMNLHKSRMSTATKSLQSSESAHKHTIAELQRTRTAVQALRATHQTEIKKLEKEKERMVERWSKLSDAQLKIGSLGAGLTCANLAIVEASDVQTRGKGQGFLDVALEQAETARQELQEQNRRLRELLLSTANELQRLLHATRTVGNEAAPALDEPAPLTLSTLFDNSAVESVSEAFGSLFSSFRQIILQKAESSIAPHACSRNNASSTPYAQTSQPQDTADLDRMQVVINKLRTELAQAQKQAAASAAQTQELFDRFSEEQRFPSNDNANMSVDLMTAPARDEERYRLDARFKELEEERQKFTEAAVRLGREKAVLEAERLKFLEEKRSWEVEMMLADLPPTPAPAASSSSVATTTVQTASSPMLSRSSPKRSARKLKVKAASSRKTRVSRRSSGLSAVFLSPRAAKVLPAYETEVIPAADSTPPSPVRPLPEFRTSIVAPSPPPPTFLTNVFVLPPPSPAASMPLRHVDDTCLPPIPPLPKLEIPPSSDDPDANDRMDVTPEPAYSVPSSSAPAQPPPIVPRTPNVRPFPMAKPFVQRMIHAYSPVKPSPLSRILMLADSPVSPENPELDALVEVDENAMDATPVPAPQLRIRSLAEELGVPEDDDSPCREKHALKKTEDAPRKPGPEPSRHTAKEKGKARMDPATGAPPPQMTSRARAGGTLEKENVKRAKLSNSSDGADSRTKSTRSSSSRNGSKAAAVKPMSTTVMRARPRTGSDQAPKAKPATKGGARRVPMGSAEAALVPSWRS